MNQALQAHSLAMPDRLVWYPSSFTPPDEKSLSQSLPASLAQAAAQWPDLPAVVFGEQSWSYADLSRRAAGLALEIEDAADTTGPVALVQSVGFDAIAAWFACALAGRPFLLLEPDHPPARLLELINAAACSLILCDPVTSQTFADQPHLNLLIPGNRLGTLRPDMGLAANQAAMIFPTSGSTGTPKLVTYSATTLQVKAQSSKLLMQVPEGARVLIAGSHGNYGFLHHAYVFLLSGGTLCLVDVKAGGFSAVIQAIDRLGVRHARFTPSMFRKLAALHLAHPVLNALDAVRFSGEPLLVSDLSLAQTVLKPDCLIQNVYGSTESALFIWSSNNSQIALDSGVGPTVPIGHLYPFASYAIAPLEDGDGSLGELHIRSAFHALGDFNAGAIDQTRFTPFQGNNEDRIYATGDIVCRLPDGSLIHLGRSGRMVKIRGHRVFPAEIENQLHALPCITGAAVIERVENDSPVIYAFITIDADQSPVEDLRQQVAQRLPDFMVPRAVLTVPQIPLMPGGKVDYKALLKQLPDWQYECSIEQVAADDKSQLISIWDSVLWPGAHVHDADFLSLGGDSLKLMTLSLEVERVFGRSMPLEDFLANSTLEHLACLLGIEQLALAAPKRQGLHFRRVWPGVQPVKGIALAMPGWGGKATAVPFGRAGLFPDHDLWAADYEFGKGTMRDSQRWWEAAQVIVESIRSGAIPPPRLIFGYSFAGGLAWLVSRLLAGTPQCPEFVVMVDSAPLHRLSRFRPGQAIRALARVSHVQAPPTVHIRRAPLSGLSLAAGNTRLWQSTDQIDMCIDMPTIDHGEMAQRDMLALAADGVRAFMSGQYCDLTVHQHPPDMAGARLHQMLSGQQKPGPQVLDELQEHISAHISADQLMALLHLTGQHGLQYRNRALIEAAIQRTPQSKLIQYAHRRQQRDAGMLCPEDMPAFLPATLAVVDQSLTGFPSRTISLSPKPLRLLCLAYDVCLATLAASRHIYSDKTRRR
jgi:acyl-coenzyme A synthetase/AMP-(fatty) acid ligase/acyl carrier protein